MIDSIDSTVRTRLNESLVEERKVFGSFAMKPLFSGPWDRGRMPNFRGFVTLWKSRTLIDS
jgi:hypothetical protein